MTSRKSWKKSDPWMWKKVENHCPRLSRHVVMTTEDQRSCVDGAEEPSFHPHPILLRCFCCSSYPSRSHMYAKFLSLAVLCVLVAKCLETCRSSKTALSVRLSGSYWPSKTTQEVKLHNSIQEPQRTVPIYSRVWTADIEGKCVWWKKGEILSRSLRALL